MSRAIKSRLASATAALLIASAWSAPAPADSADDLGGLARRGRLGVQVSHRPADPENPEAGLVVFFPAIIPGGAAEAAGLQPGDEVLGANGQPVASVQEFMQAVGPLRAGEGFEFKLRRGGEEIALGMAKSPAPLEESREGIETFYDAIEVGDDLFRAIVTKPEGPGPFPALLYIPGNSCISVEVGPGGHPALESIERFAYDLPRRGFAVLRAEKSGMGDSQGDPCADVDFETDTAGFAAGLEKLKSYGFVDPDNVFIFGHSMGGIQAPLIAKDSPVKGIAVYGTGGINWFEYMLVNERRQSELAGADPGDIDEALANSALFNAYYFLEGLSPEEIATKSPLMAELSAQAFPDGVHFMGRHHAYWSPLGRINIARAWRDAGANVLAVWGTADYVSARSSHERLAAIANHYRPGSGEFAAIEGADHTMIRSGDYAGAMAMMASGWAGAETEDKVLEAIFEWLERQAGLKPAKP